MAVGCKIGFLALGFAGVFFSVVSGDWVYSSFLSLVRERDELTVLMLRPFSFCGDLAQFTLKYCKVLLHLIVVSYLKSNLAGFLA